MKYFLIFFSLYTTFSFGQTAIVKKSRKSYSPQTQKVLRRLDSLLCADTLAKCEGVLESQRIGEASSISEEYLCYAELIKVATENELLKLLDNPKELPPIRGYAYMAYAYKCDQEHRKEKPLNYNFKINVQIGCEVNMGTTFSSFKQDIRVRNFYDPNPRHFVMDSQEKEAINAENKIRKEQGETLRKEQVKYVLLSEKFIYDTLFTIEEVKQRNKHIDSLTNHKHGIAMLMHPPEGDEKDYWVQVGYNGELRFETHFNFYINPINRQITIDEVVSGERLTLDEWRKQKNSNK